MTLVLELPAELETALHERACERGISVEELVIQYLRELLENERKPVARGLLRVHNLAAIEAHGGYICGNDDFQLVCCDVCGCRYLYNAEILQLYFDHTNLSCVVWNIEGEQRPPCWCCGALNWKIKNLTSADTIPKNQEDWAWLFDGNEK